MGANEPELRRTKQRLALSHQPVFPGLNALIATVMNMMERAYRTMADAYPKMKYVDYGTEDLELVDYGGDQRGLGRGEGMRHVETVASTNQS